MKKKIVINTVLTLLITIIFIFGETFVETYPYFTISDVIHNPYFNDILWILFLTMGSIFIISFVSKLIGRKFNIRILKHIGTILLSIVFIFLSVIYFAKYLQSKHEYKERLVYYTDQAKEGMENDKIKIERFTGLSPYIKEGKFNTVDSIMGKYGVVIWYNRFPYSRIDVKAKEKYLEIVNAYLIERNGEDWRQRMNKELEPYIDTLVVVIKK